MTTKTLSKISIEDRISALSLCADILDYPESEIFDKIEELNLLLDLGIKVSQTLEDLQAEYLRLFNINSQKFKTVPYASWWIDNRFYGKSLQQIDEFYKKLGYKYDKNSMKKPADNLSSMIIFLTILAEEQKFKEFKEFTKFLTWIDDLANSLYSSSWIGFYGNIVATVSKLINSIKEEI